MACGAQRPAKGYCSSLNQPHASLGSDGTRRDNLKITNPSLLCVSVLGASMIQILGVP